ncbi:hypothetical protein BJF93_20700 [Xaviernesmea oryzae]|uniref:CidA/LrgA family protein n=1 Tax=Xaviernesmea oryzae TaxID=464029 RepID=A0A1Q9AZS9_9HYPH|nr:CidA/LrgA family protein [Xaviernesmea oryzae]OLP61214.1 hypothetical protein BJF93_20700 [Xaviernesmea oryzae]SEL50584.1 Putative effector of murein hydrolase LrgA, UPF0299 family [Xaviernesmea oryzae]
MPVGITILLAFQLIGEIIAYALQGVVPGPVIGMTLIFLTLSLLKGRLPGFEAATMTTSRVLLANLGVLFVPAGVGIIQHLDLLARRGPALLAVILVSTLATLIVTVFTFLATKRLMGMREHD